MYGDTSVRKENQTEKYREQKENAHAVSFEVGAGVIVGKLLVVLGCSLGLLEPRTCGTLLGRLMAVGERSEGEDGDEEEEVEVGDTEEEEEEEWDEDEEEEE